MSDTRTYTTDIEKFEVTKAFVHLRENNKMFNNPDDAVKWLSSYIA